MRTASSNGTGVTQTVEHDTRELRVCILPFEELLADQYRLCLLYTSDPVVCEWKCHRSTDKSYPGDNRLISPKSPHRRDVYKRQGTMCKWSDPFSKRVLIDRGLDHNSLETFKSTKK